MKRPSKAKLRRDVEFKNSLETVFSKFGGTYSTSFHDWHFDTPAGPLKVSIDADGQLYTLFCRFAKNHAHEVYPYLQINPYSGKYNFHMTAPTSKNELEYVIQQAWSHIARVL